jgi:hypothetical protein
MERVSHRSAIKSYLEMVISQHSTTIVCLPAFRTLNNCASLGTKCVYLHMFNYILYIVYVIFPIFLLYNVVLQYLFIYICIYLYWLEQATYMYRSVCIKCKDTSSTICTNARSSPMRPRILREKFQGAYLDVSKNSGASELGDFTQQSGSWPLC